MKQNIKVNGSKDVKIIQAGRDVYYGEQKKSEDLQPQRPQQSQQPQEPSLSALVMMGNPFIEYRNNRPVPIQQLELNKEKNLLDEKLKNANAGIFVDFVPATTHILQEKLMVDKYRILHFIGHGTDEGKGGLYFEDNYGAAHILKPDELKELLKGKDIWLLVLNACHSEKIAARLKNLGIRAIVSVDRTEEILDISAIVFSAFFYSALSQGMKVIDAFKEGKKGVKLGPGLEEDARSESQKYKLIPKEGGNFSLIEKDISASYSSSAIENKTLNLPPLPFTFVGREEEIVKINKAFLDSKPVITLKGLPGVGKTTLSAKVGSWHKVHPYFDTIIFVDCTKQPSHHKILEEIGKGIFGEDFYSTQEKWREDKVTKELNGLRYLIILDNFEDVEEKVLTGKLLKRIERSRIIITSREDTGLIGFEQIIEVPLLSKVEGIDLFKEHAKGIGYKISEVDSEIISEIVEALEGLPLAIELSARQLSGSYNLQSLLKDIKENITQILRDETLIVEEKNKSLAASFRLSYGRLSDEEKELFTRFSVFRGMVDKEAVEKVCEIKDSQKVIGGLIRKSLIQKKNNKFYMLVSLRDYGYQKLSEERKIYYHQRAANYFASLPIPEMEKRRSKKDILLLLEAHYHACQSKNYEQAYQVIFDNGLDKDLPLWSEYVILLELCKGILEKPSSIPKEKEGILLGTLGVAYYGLSQFNKAIGYSQQALNIVKETGNRVSEGYNLDVLGNTYRNLGQFEKAIGYSQQGLDIARKIRHRENECGCLGNLGSVYSRLGQFEKAIEYYQQGLDIAKEIKHRVNEGRYLGNLGDTYRNLGQFDKAIKYLQQGLDIAKEIRDLECECAWLGNIGLTYSSLGQHEKAIEYCQQALDISRETGDRKHEGLWLGNLGSTYHDLLQFEKAIEYYHQALDIVREIEDLFFKGHWLNKLGEVYTAQAKYDLALSYLLQSQEIRKEIKDPEFKKTEENINKLKSTLGDTKFHALLSKTEEELGKGNQ